MEEKTAETNTPVGDMITKKKRKESSQHPTNVSFGVVCSSNMNRSMEAHLQFEKHKLVVYSYGVGNRIRLPGPGGQSVFEFGTAYETIREELISSGYEEWFREKGLLKLLERNINIKDGPERFQDCEDVDKLDVVFCFETRVFDILIENLESRKILHFEPIYAMNLDVTDSADEAVVGAEIALDLCQRLEDIYQKGVFEAKVFEVVQAVEDKYKRAILCKICYL